MWSFRILTLRRQLTFWSYLVRPIPKLVDADPEDQALLGHLLLVAGRVANDLGVGEGFRLVINNGEGGGQTVFHLHLHILAGRPMEEGELSAQLA